MRNKTMNYRQPIALVLTCWFGIAPLTAQDASISVEKPKAPFVVRPYLPPTVPPVELKDSNRLRNLIRGGKLYLTLQDAIALAIENNLELEVDRYGPVAADWQLERAEAGGPLRGVTSGNSLVNQATSGQGVVGSEISAGLASNNNGGSNSGGNAIVSQIGPISPNLDAVLQNATLFSHVTSPQQNLTLSQTSALVGTHHVFDTVLQQGLITGGYVQVAVNQSYLKENTPTDVLNPSDAPVGQIYVRHNFLQGFGPSVNNRFIRVARLGLVSAQETFKSQLLNIVVATLDLYWDLVTDNEALKARQRTLETAQKFFDDTNAQIGLGVVARVEAIRAKAELTTRQQEVSIAQATVRQQENLLKGQISKGGVIDQVFEEAEIVTLDRIQVPEQEALPPLRELVGRALAKRPDVALARLTQQSAEISAIGTQNGLLPSLQGLAAELNSGLAGTAVPQPGGPSAQADPYFVGGLGTAFGQVVRRNFPNERAAISYQGTIGNHIAQGDYGVDQLQLRQEELVNRRSLNQIVVDVSNQVIALRQARARYSTAVETRLLQEQLLEKEQQKFKLGVSSVNDLIALQRTLGAARVSEVGALSVYSHAHISLDQVVGETLENNNVATSDALQGHMPRESTLPAEAGK
jgi:outer membrane protein